MAEQVDKLRQLVATPLLVEYEKTQLPIGKTLKQVITDREMIKTDPIIRQWAVSKLLIASCVFAGTLVYFHVSLNMPATALILFILIFGGLTYLVMHRQDIRCLMDRQIIIDSDWAFETFIRTMKDLSSMNVTVREYNEKSIRGCLVELAYNILYAEEQLDEVRLRKERMTEEILNRASALVKCNNEFENALTAASKFGLKFKRSDLFDSAENLPRIGGRS